MTPDAVVAAGEAARLLARDADTGRLLATRVSLAVTRATRRRGLLGRDGLDRGEALWIAPSRGVHTCGMRFAIDVVALDREGRVVDCVQTMRPWRIRLPRRGTVGVLELPAGSVALAGTRAGHRVSFEAVRDAARPAEGGRQPV
jgi:hypothetical protein